MCVLMTFNARSLHADEPPRYGARRYTSNLRLRDGASNSFYSRPYASSQSTYSPNYYAPDYSSTYAPEYFPYYEYDTYSSYGSRIYGKDEPIPPGGWPARMDAEYMQRRYPYGVGYHWYGAWPYPYGWYWGAHFYRPWYGFAPGYWLYRPWYTYPASFWLYHPRFATAEYRLPYYLQGGYYR
jgi:hypothetical protein